MIQASTQSHLDVKDIDKNLVVLKDGGVSLVLQINSLNFDLLSEPEQDAIIASYSGLLNSLSFYIQVLVISKRTDVSTYLSKVSQAQERQTNPLIKEKIASYKSFVQQLISKNDVLAKNFYIVVPFKSPLASGGSNSPIDTLKKAFGISATSSKEIRFDKADLIKRALIDLEPKRDHIMEQLRRCGLKSQQLNSEQLVTLFYEIYNQDQAKSQPINEGVESYTTPIVEPLIKN